MNPDLVYVQMWVNMPPEEYLEFLIAIKKIVLKDSFSGQVVDGMLKSINIINANADMPQVEKNLLISQFIKFAWELQKARPHWWLISVLEKGMQYIPENELLAYLANLVKISISGESYEVRHLTLWSDTIIKIKSKTLLEGYSKLLKETNNKTLQTVVLLELQADYDVTSRKLTIKNETEYQRYVIENFQIGRIKLHFTTKRFGLPTYLPCQMVHNKVVHFGYPNAQYFIEYAKVLGVSLQGYSDNPTFSVELPIVLFNILPSLMQPIIEGLQKDWEAQRDSICAHIGIPHSELEVSIYEWLGVKDGARDFIDKLYISYRSSGQYYDSTFLEWVENCIPRLQTPLDKQKWICWKYQDDGDDDDGDDE